jgi:uncharacterized membrane protein
MNPFDLKTVLLAKHAQHVVLIHFPIALFIAGVALDLFAQWRKSVAARGAAYWNLVLAAVSTVPVLLTGVLAWRWALGAPRLKGILLEHLLLAITSAVLIWIVGWIHFRAGADDNTLPGYRLPIEVVAVLLLGATAHLGGFLSGVNLPG